MVATAAAGAAFKEFAKVLGSSKSAKTMKLFAESMKSIEETAKIGGFDALKQSIEKLQSVVGSPVFISGQVLLGRLAAGTADKSVNLLNEMLELLENPTVQTGVNLFIAGINLVAGKAAEVVDDIDDAITGVTNFFNLLGAGWNTAIEDMLEQLDPIRTFFEAIWAFFFGRKTDDKTFTGVVIPPGGPSGGDQTIYPTDPGNNPFGNFP
jgi:hypothetical protein